MARLQRISLARRIFRLFLFSTLFALLAYLVLCARNFFLPLPERTRFEVSDGEAVRFWKEKYENSPIAVWRVTPDTNFIVLTDLDDDGVIDDCDRKLKMEGIPELVRLDDSVCNGRHWMADRTALLDDDLQLLSLFIPDPPNPGVQLGLESDDEARMYFTFYTSDFLDASAEVQWPLDMRNLCKLDSSPDKYALWVRVKGSTGLQGLHTLTFSIIHEGKPTASDSIQVRCVGALGDPYYFAAARDYLTERDRASQGAAEVFTDVVQCGAGRHTEDFETFRLLVMRHELTKMEVLETYHNRNEGRPRTATISDAIRRHADQTVIVNGNYFYLSPGLTRHGEKALGAVVHNGEVSPASFRHRWWTAYKDAGIYEQPDWQFTVFSLVQPEDRCGQIELKPEPYSPNDVYIPTTEKGQQEVPVDEALGGLHTLHNSIYTEGMPKSLIGIAAVPAEGGLPAHRVIWLAMSQPTEGGYAYGASRLRERLRGSGVVVDDTPATPTREPGPTELAYLDGGASPCMALKISDLYEVPVRGISHIEILSGPRVNNYLMFRVENCAD